MTKWLLDVNVNQKLIPIFQKYGIEAESAISLGWRQLTNGALVTAAVEANFNVMLTNDVRIELSAERGLKIYPDFSLVLLKLPQLPSIQYLLAMSQT